MQPPDFAKLERDIKRRKQGRITLENVYVVLLVTAWASIVLLVCCVSTLFACIDHHHHHQSIIVILGVVIAVYLPPDFIQTVLNGYRCFDEVASGWNEGFALYAL